LVLSSAADSETRQSLGVEPRRVSGVVAALSGIGAVLVAYGTLMLAVGRERHVGATTTGKLVLIFIVFLLFAVVAGTLAAAFTSVRPASGAAIVAVVLVLGLWALQYVTASGEISPGDPFHLVLLALFGCAVTVAWWTGVLAAHRLQRSRRLAVVVVFAAAAILVSTGVWAIATRDQRRVETDAALVVANLLPGNARRVELREGNGSVYWKYQIDQADHHDLLNEALALAPAYNLPASQQDDTIVVQSNSTKVRLRVRTPANSPRAVVEVSAQAD
jgi:hypothetical protein